MRWEQVPDLPLFADNTAAFIHELDAATISNVAGALRVAAVIARTWVVLK